MDVKGYLVGGFPRPASLIKSLREHMKGRKSSAELDAEILEAVKEVVRLQKDNGLYYIFDGQLTWDDLFRPIATCLTNVQIDGLARWFDNNFFYKKPVFNSSDVRLKRCLRKNTTSKGSSRLEDEVCFSRALHNDRHERIRQPVQSGIWAG
jgi:methionine synthase II (cobalamin-independent)